MGKLRRRTRRCQNGQRSGQPLKSHPAGWTLLFSLFAGCAPETAPSLEKPGVSQMQLMRDQNECFAQAIDGTNQQYGGLIRVDRDLYQRCMEQRGYISPTARS